MRPPRTLMHVGVLVGGASRRMGQPKGRLHYRGEPLLIRAIRAVRDADQVPILVGDASPYEDLVPGVERLVDAPSGIGPLGGLRALLLRGNAIVIGCDMPHVRASTLVQLAKAGRGQLFAGSRSGDGFEPFPAFYGAESLRVLELQLVHRRHSIRAFIDSIPAPQRSEVMLDDVDRIDWDTPEDIGARS